MLYTELNLLLLKGKITFFIRHRAEDKYIQVSYFLMSLYG